MDSRFFHRVLLLQFRQVLAHGVMDVGCFRVQGALLAFRLDAAIKAGCRFAFSSTDKPGPSSRNLKRFGFRALSTSFTMAS